MTQERIQSWLRQTSTMHGVVNAMNQNIDELKGNLHIASAVENAKHEANLQTELDRVQRDRDRMLAELLHRVNTSDLEGVTARLVDIEARLALAEQAFVEWRKRLAQHEHYLTCGLYVSEDSAEGAKASMMNQLLENVEQQYRAALANADLLVPNKAVLIH